jgi:DNA-binding PadR family transcriptional regulator
MKQLNARQGLVGLLTSDSYQLLCLLDSLQAETLEGPRVRESQEEIAELFHVSKGKLNPLMQSLVASGCIQKFRARSGYTLTPLGTQVVAHIGKLEALERSLSKSAS